jgi:hypothetical protein
LLAACVEERVCARPDPPPAIALSTIEADPACQPIESVEMQSGEREPSSHELLRAYAAQKGANYVVLDAFGAITTIDDVLAVTRARLFRCPIALTSYRSYGSR